MQECETDDDNGNRVFDGYEDTNGDYFPVEDILKQADFIEELFDGFVCQVDDYYFYHHDLYIIKAIGEHKKIKVYGAIEILGEHGEPIIKSVAVMDKRERFELL